MFILQDFFFISSAFLSKSSGDCMYESREAGGYSFMLRLRLRQIDISFMY